MRGQYAGLTPISTSVAWVMPGATGIGEPEIRVVAGVVAGYDVAKVRVWLPNLAWSPAVLECKSLPEIIKQSCCIQLGKCFSAFDAVDRQIKPCKGPVVQR